MFKKVSDKYYIRNKKGKGFKEYRGEPVQLDGLKDKDIFIFGEVGKWRITDAITGQTLFNYNGARKSAIRECSVELKRALEPVIAGFMDLMSITKEEAFVMAYDERINQEVKESGLSPRYKETP